MVAVNHFYAEELDDQTKADSGFATVISIAGASLVATTKYLIVARAHFGGSNNNEVFEIRVSTADDATIASKSSRLTEPTVTATNRLKPYFFVHSFTTDSSPADVLLEMQAPDTFTARADQLNLFLLDLTDLGASNYFETISADDSGEYPTTQATEFSIAGSNLGTDEWLILAYQRTGIGSSTRNYRVEAHAAADTSTSAVRSKDEMEGQDVTELDMSGFALRHKASSGTPDFEIQTWEEHVAANALDRGGYAIALKTSAFADFQAEYTAASTLLDATERTMQTITSYSPVTTADHLLFGSWDMPDTDETPRHSIHIEDDDVEMRVGDIGQNPVFTNEGTATPIHYIFHLDNILSSDTSTYTLRGSSANASSANVEHRWLIMLSLELVAGGAGSASPATIARSFTVDATTQVGPAVDVQDVINRAFTVDAPAAKGAAVDVQDVIARSFGIGATTQVGGAVDLQAVINRAFALDQVTPTNSDGGAGTASPAVIARLFTVDDVTPVGGAVDLQALIARLFTVEDVTPVGPAVDLQAVINRSFALGATTQVGPAVDVQSVINRLFALGQVTPVNSDGVAGTATPDVIALAFTIPSAAGFVVLVHVQGPVVVVFDPSTADAGLDTSLASVDLDPTTAWPGLDRSSAKS